MTRPREQLVCIDQPSGLFALFDRWLGAAVMLALGLFLLLLPVFIAPKHPAGYWLPYTFGTIAFITGLGVAAHIRAGRSRRITIDYNQRTVTFENFRPARPFTLGIRRVPELVLPFDGILAAKVLRSSRGPDSLYIATTRGRITLNGSARNFRELHLALQEIAETTPPPPFIYTPQFVWVGSFAAMFGAMLLFFVAYALGWLEPLLRWLDG